MATIRELATHGDVVAVGSDSRHEGPTAFVQYSDGHTVWFDSMDLAEAFAKAATAGELDFSALMRGL